MIETDDVVLDMDGVLADFEGYFCKRFGNEKRNLTKLDERYPNKALEIDDFVLDPITYQNLYPIGLGKQIALWLDKNGFEIHIVSSRPASAYSITKNWLVRNGIPFHSLYVDNTLDKVVQIHRINPAFAIDDQGFVADKLSKFGIPIILISQPWNMNFRQKYPRIHDFRSFLYRFEQISKAPPKEVVDAKRKVRLGAA